ncbi:MAG TPA: gamma-glutamyltransferase, partial [Gemmatimonadaceae bacterium]
MVFRLNPLLFSLLQATASRNPAVNPALPAQQQPSDLGARQPAFARDGRLALSIRGDIWVLSPSGEWTQVTSGAASDREPAWSFDGGSIVFSSDRSGKLDLWRVPLTGGKPGVPEQLTHSLLPDGQPAIAPDGRIIFTRGRGAASQLWVHPPTGTESRLTTNRATERSATISPDGLRVAYVALDETGRHVRVRTLSGASDDVVVTDPRIDRLTWAADANRVAFTASGRNGGVYLIDLSTKAITPFTERRVEVAWVPGGSRVAITDGVPEDQVGYNGDPDRLGDRSLVNVFAPGGSLAIGDPASALSAAPVDLHFPTPSRAARNADAFDQAWGRTAQLYYSQADAAERRAQWENLRDRFRSRALNARDDDELRSIIHDMLAEHPPYRQSASGQAAVSSANPIATEAGLTALRAGGNVVDAAVAVSFALGVVEPDASGPGGYGQMLIYKAGTDRPKLIEFMTRVPEDAGLGNPNAPSGRGGGAAVANVPGTVAAMYLAWQRYGSKKVPWAELLAPAIKAARDGYPVSEGLATTLTVEREGFMQSEGSRALFFKDGSAPHAGDTLKNPDLAWTL